MGFWYVNVSWNNVNVFYFILLLKKNAPSLLRFYKFERFLMNLFECANSLKVHFFTLMHFTLERVQARPIIFYHTAGICCLLCTIISFWWKQHCYYTPPCIILHCQTPQRQFLFSLFLFLYIQTQLYMLG